jgi:hypothetical protein
MFTYFYNKFRPVNCMHYLLRSSNILHNSGCCKKSVASWTTILPIKTFIRCSVTIYNSLCETTVFKYSVVWHSMQQGTMHRSTSHCVHSEDGSGYHPNKGGSNVCCFRLTSVAYGGCQVLRHLLPPQSVLQ